MLKKIIIYGIGTFFSKILVFLMLPVYTRVFSPSDYGYYDVLLANMQLIVSIAFMEVWSGIIRFMFDDEDTYTPINTFIHILPVFMLLYAAIFFVFSRFFIIRFPLITFCYGIAYLLFYVMNSVCRGLRKNIDYAVSGAISTVVSCAFSFLLVVVFHKGIASLFLSLIAGYACGVAYVELRTHAVFISIKKKSSRKNYHDMLSYCFPLMINTFSYSFMTLFNKNMIMKHLGASVSGYYAVAEKVAVALSLAISIYMLSWQEEAYSFAESERRSEIYSYYLNQYIKCIGLVIPIYMLVCYFIMPVISGANFVASFELIPLFVVQVYISNLSSFLCLIISANKKSMQILVSTVFGAAANSILIYVLIPKFGILASNISLCVGFATCAFARYMFASQFARLKVKIVWHCMVILEFVLAYVLFRLDKPLFIFVSTVAFCLIWFLANFEMVKGYGQKALRKGVVR